MKNVAIIAIFAALIVGIVIYALWPDAKEKPDRIGDPTEQAHNDEDSADEEQPSEEGPNERMNPVEPADDAPAEAVTRWTLGVTRSYTVSFRRDVVLGEKTNPVAKQVHSATGRWGFTITDGPDESGQYRARARLEVSEWSMTDLPPDANEAVLAGLGEPYFFVLKSNGAITDILFSPTIHAASRQLLASLTFVAQQTETDDGKQAWRTDEMDVYGTYSAVYRQRTEEDDSGQTRILQRMKAGYAQQNPQFPAEMVPSIHHKTRFTMASHGWYRNIDSTETQDLEATDRLPELHSTVAVTFDYLQNTQDDTMIGAFDKEKGQLVSFLSTPTTDTNAAPDDAALLGDLTLPQILEALRALGELRADDAARDAWIPKLSALFRLYPDQAMIAAQAIKDGMSEWAAVAVLSGLAGAENQAAHDALVSMLTWASSEGKTLLGPTLMAMGQSRFGSGQASATLAALAKSEPPGSPYLSLIGGALAMQAAALEGPDGGASALAWESVESMWQNVTSPEQKAALVGQIGKSHHSKALGLLTEAVQHDNALVRAGAATALSDYSGAGPDNTLVLLIQNDTAADVRRAAILSSAGRNSDLFLEAYETILTQNTSGTDVLALLKVLETNPGLIQAFKDVLIQLKTKSTNAEITTMVELLLGK